MIFTESKLEFDFDEAIWNGLKKMDSHPDYKKLEILNGSKAVDFIGFCGNNLFFIEVKNFRGHGIENTYRTSKNGDKLMDEVGRKVKDTLACMIGGARNSTNSKQDWQECISHLRDDRRIKIVLWMEEDNPKPKREKAGLSIYQTTLKRN